MNECDEAAMGAGKRGTVTVDHMLILMQSGNYRCAWRYKAVLDAVHEAQFDCATKASAEEKEL